MHSHRSISRLQRKQLRILAMDPCPSQLLAYCICEEMALMSRSASPSPAALPPEAKMTPLSCMHAPSPACELTSQSEPCSNPTCSHQRGRGGRPTSRGELPPNGKTSQLGLVQILAINR
ncbi:hypothetical protein LIA77_02688 [Sarocladium implicatum]|nr:hypothetical protein LIA77_02688 [Sarocladium implicatum]